MKSLFPADESVASARLRLSAPPRDAIESMSGWLEAALAPEWGLADLEDALEASTAVLISDASDGEAIGLALASLDRPREGEATIPFLTIRPERRFRGLGGEAGIALDRYLRTRGAAGRVYAGVPEGRGLAVYFWLRLGFRPLGSAEAPRAPLGLTSETRPGIWMLRDTP